MLNEFDLNRLFAETGELRNIIAASIVTALKNDKRKPHISSNM
jgi:hypothetical protein